jgi:hypothetical protein
MPHQGDLEFIGRTGILCLGIPSLLVGLNKVMELTGRLNAPFIEEDTNGTLKGHEVKI